MADNSNQEKNSEQNQIYSSELLEEARNFFSQDKYASKATGIQLEQIGEHYAQCSLEIQDIHKNAYGGVMGGVIFTLADFTFAASSNFRQPLTVSVTAQVNFIGMAKGKKLISQSKLIKDGRTTCLYEINIADELGTKVAFVTISGMKLSQ